MTYTTQVNQVPPIQEQVEKTIDEVSEKEDQVSLTVVSNKKEQTLCGASKFVVYSYFLCRRRMRIVGVPSLLELSQEIVQ